jgi:hypothetical protein
MIGAADLHRQYAAQMMSIGMGRIERQNLGIKGIRLAQPPGTVVVERLGIKGRRIAQSRYSDPSPRRGLPSA